MKESEEEQLEGEERQWQRAVSCEAERSIPRRAKMRMGEANYGL